MIKRRGHAAALDKPGDRPTHVICLEFIPPTMVAALRPISSQTVRVEFAPPRFAFMEITNAE
jgi:hypothetical protein